MFTDDSFLSYIVALDFEDGRKYLFSRRFPVFCPDYAKKYYSKDAAYTAYYRSDFYKAGIKATLLVYDRSKSCIRTDITRFD